MATLRPFLHARASRARILLAAVAGCLCLLAAVPAAAGAAGWPAFGGFGGSGHDAFDSGAGTDVVSKWSPPVQPLTVARSSPLVTAGAPSGQRVIHATVDGKVHIRELTDGDEVGTPGGVQVDDSTVDDTDTFGSANGAITPIDVSKPSGGAYVYVLHNDADQGGGTDDVALAQIDASTGSLVQDVAVPGTNGYVVNASPVMTAPDAGGDAEIFFTADDSGTKRLVKMAIADVRSASASFGGSTTSAVASGANAHAAPALVWLEDSGGTPTQYVAVGSTGTTIMRTYAVSDFTAGPIGPPGASTTGQTPVVPVTADGKAPGSPGSGLTKAPSIYIAGDNAGVTVVYRLFQTGSATMLENDTSSPLNGAPAPSLATSERVGSGAVNGVVAVTTENNLYVLDNGLSQLGQLSVTDLSPGTTGFSRTTASLTDDYVFAMNDRGGMHVLNASDATAVSPSEFSEPSQNGTSSEAYGQPAVAGGHAIFATEVGAFAFTTADGTAPRLRLLGPAGQVSGSVALEAEAADARGIASVEFKVDGVPVGTDTSADSGSPYDLPGARYSVSLDTLTLASGQHTLNAVATDANGITTSKNSSFEVSNPPVSTPPPAVDTDAPAVAFTRKPRGGYRTRRPTFEFGAPDAVAFECRTDTQDFAPCASPHRTAALTEARHSFEVRARDAAGNAAVLRHGFRVDLTDPRTSIEAGPTGDTRDSTPAFRFDSNERRVTYECAADGERFRPCDARHVAGPLLAGRHTLRVRAVDEAGNEDPSPAERAFVVVPDARAEAGAAEPVPVGRSGVAPVTVTCHSRAAACEGTIQLDAIIPRKPPRSCGAQVAQFPVTEARKGRRLNTGRGRGRGRGRRIGWVRFKVGAHSQKRVRMRLSHAGRRMLRRYGRLNVRVTVRVETPTGVETSVSTIVLRARGGARCGR